jgi:hypothetical protein
MSCVATYSTRQSLISEKPRIPEARFPGMSLLGSWVNKGARLVHHLLPVDLYE